eukprot:scaffold21958_cov66-Phaeocystis_antarctica.AAC.5
MEVATRGSVKVASSSGGSRSCVGARSYRMSRASRPAEKRERPCTHRQVIGSLCTETIQLSCMRSMPATISSALANGTPASGTLAAMDGVLPKRKAFSKVGARTAR